MKFTKLYCRRRAVSPILAAILLIGLAVSAGAVLFVVVLPMIQSSGELKFGSVNLTDVDTDGTNDKVVFTLTNERAKTVTITSITLLGDGTTAITNVNTTTTFPFNIATSQSKLDITYFFAPGSYTTVKIRVQYSVESIAQDPLTSTSYDLAA